MHAKKIRQYNLIFTVAAFLMIMLAIIIAVAFNKQQQIFFSEAQNFAKTASLSVSQATFLSGARVSVLIYADKSIAQDWIGLFPMHSQDAIPLSKQYLSRCPLQQQGTVSIGYCTFTAPDTAGEYIFRLFRDTFYITATSPITVDAASVVRQEAQ